MDKPEPTRRAALGGLVSLLALPPVRAAAGAAPAAAAAVMAAPALARDAPPAIDPAGFLGSEKYDGVRALWDGRVLRFRSGLEIAAPAQFTAGLPPLALDGELWLGRGRFEALSGLVRRADPPAAGWRELRYMVFDLPGAPGPFGARAARLAAIVRAAARPALQAAPQEALADRAALRRRLADVVGGGGEGLVLHRADAWWRPGRNGALVKLKPLADAEAVVLGHVPGRGRHAGRMGALRVRTAEGQDLLLGTGFSDAQRAQPPAPGAIVTFSYRGRTATGLPRFASFVRERDPLRS